MSDILERVSLALSIIVLVVLPYTTFYIKATVRQLIQDAAEKRQKDIQQEQDRHQFYRDRVNKHDQTLYGETGENGIRADVKRLKDRVHDTMDKMQVLTGEVTQLERAFTSFHRRRSSDEENS